MSFLYPAFLAGLENENLNYGYPFVKEFLAKTLFKIFFIIFVGFYTANLHKMFGFY